MRKTALDGIKVLDLGQGVSAPYCARVLADFGADVLKVEPPGEGDASRSSGPFPDDVPDIEKSALYLYLNAGKQGITLNPETKYGHDLL
ncbi:MAG: CoA transferase, partial [Dehalococcoidia bacterium]|nr:CoA transferase [Dehalococcoidia bacterium]